MRRAVSLTTLGALAAAWPLACGSLNKGQVVIVDESAGTPSTGGTSGSAGKGGGGTAGATAGKGGSSGKGGTAGDAGEAGVGTGANGGSGNGGKGGSTSSGGTGGSSTGGTGTGGGAGETPTGCVELADCAGTKPICDDGMCRACSTVAMPDECAELTDRPYCHGASGRCVACLGNDDCPGSSQSVCDAGVCRGCEEGSECESGACYSGRCAPESSVVYALAGAGSYDTDCGTLAKPCMRLLDAAGKLSGSSPYLVLIETSAKFTYENAVLPSMTDIWVFGNHVTIEGYDSPIFTKSGGALYLDDVVVSAYTSGTTGVTAVDLANVSLHMRKGAIYNDNKAYGAAGLKLTDSSADIQQVEFWNTYTGLVFQGTAGTPGQALTVERCLFQNNFQALDLYADHFTVRNNLFVANGLEPYTRVIRLSMVTNGVFAYNTLYGNDNNCSFDGGLIACGGAETCGINSSNLFWGNMFGGMSGMPCPGQVYPYPATIAYTLAEQTWAGVGNIDGSLSGNDPRLANPAAGDFKPSSGSPVIDAGDTDPAVVPAVDYYGNPRPVGAGPDIGAIEAE